MTSPDFFLNLKFSECYAHQTIKLDGIEIFDLNKKSAKYANFTELKYFFLKNENENENETLVCGNVTCPVKKFCEKANNEF